MELKVEATNVFKRNFDAFDKYRTIVNQGGARSSKTYSIVQLILIKCLSETGKVYSIVRKTFPALKASVMRDLEELIDKFEIRGQVQINKSDSIYKINGNMIEFFSLDNAQKVRGAKRDHLYMNEANELSWEEAFQLMVRTSGTVFIDFNPSDSKHWIYSQILKEPDSILIKSTYRDNPFCSPEVIKQLKKLEFRDPVRWKVYGLGEPGIGDDNIFPLFTEVDNIPTDAMAVGIGLDWGFTNDPTAVVRAYIKDRDLYLEELIYTHGLTNHDINSSLTAVGLDKNDIIYCDSAEPKSIKELSQFGWNNIRAAKKGKGSILSGISLLKSYNIHIKGDKISTEFHNYKWKKDKAGDPINTPIDSWNHIIDAARYVISMTQIDEAGDGEYHFHF